MTDTPDGTAVIAPFVFADRADDLIDFVVHVFDARDVPEARTRDDDGLILHSELIIGDSMLTIADRKPHWPFTPAFLRVYVDDAAEVLARAQARGARVVTEPTDFFGDVFSRFQDPWGNLWWVYVHHPAQADDWQQSDAAHAPADAEWTTFATPELGYIHSTLVEAMDGLRDPREGDGSGRTS
ncbi:VOC family protein [Microbacterium stercoris]|uniref:VOC family protein n=1 Tax=Microbacterium stercoris TaxID=2820289 RepID=A0A939TU38_9MICO|nr:VOC family protein [Microbacterium stercoris]MBO3663614.1 VOC family protein [Microbacterium stercoris]